MTPGEAAARFAPGAEVQSPFGKGVVRDVRNNGRVLIEVQGRAILMDVWTLRLVAEGDKVSRRATERPRGGVESQGAVEGSPRSGPAANAAGLSHGVREIDLHGLTVEEALVHIGHVLDGAMRDDVEELRVIHGRGGGRLRAALHRHLNAIPSVRGFGLDPRNEGVTVVRL